MLVLSIIPEFYQLFSLCSFHYLVKYALIQPRFKYKETITFITGACFVDSLFVLMLKKRQLILVFLWPVQLKELMDRCQSFLDRKLM